MTEINIENQVDQIICKYQSEGWILVSRIGNVIQMKHAKTFGFIRFSLCVVGLFTFGILTLFLLLDYAVRKEPLILITYNPATNIYSEKELAW
jgi:hypothetical protein